MPRRSPAADDRRRRPAFLVVLLGAALTACVPFVPPDAGSGSAAAGSVVVHQRQTERFIELIGPRAQHAPPYLGTPDTNFYCLRSFVDRKTGDTADQLYVADSYDGTERDWDAAHDAAGRRLRFFPISRDEITCEGGCSYTEEFAADIPKRGLKASPQGFAVTFTDRAGDRKTIRVSAEQIAAQLAAFAAQPKPMPASAASPEPPPAAAHQP